VNILAADKLMSSPRLYATTLLWLLSELFEELPEVGDPDKPRLVFFFDEAHLLFNDAPKALVAKVEQVARLIRSKGVGVYFITQNPDDVPENILGQLGNRVQHALRAFTARDQKQLKKAAETYRANPRFDTETAIREVGTGEAVTSMLEAKGAPGVVERTLVRPPSSRLGPITEEERRAVLLASPIAGKYDTPGDRESAYEILQAAPPRPRPRPRRPNGRRPRRSCASANTSGPSATPAPGRGPRRRPHDGFAQPPARDAGRRAVQAVIKELSGTTGKRLVRGILGGLFRGR
jgi:uncharacterized protein